MTGGRSDAAASPGRRGDVRIRRAAARLILAAAALSHSSCASPGPAVEARRGLAPSRPGPEEPYLVRDFRIGWYDTIRKPETPGILAAGGFDSVMPYVGNRSMEQVRSFLDAADEAGVGVHLDVPRAAVRDRDGRALEEYIREFRDSPALLSWYLYDEPEWKPGIRPGMLERSYSRIKDLDPQHPVALVFMFPSLAGAYRGAMDSYWIDHYPVLKGRSEFHALRGGQYADKLKRYGQSADRLGLPLTFVAQGYGQGEDGSDQFRRRLPTPEEARYMFWASFLARPEEVLYWTLYRTRESWFRETLVPLVREFRELFPDALEYRSAEGFRISGGDAEALVLGDGRGGLRLLLLGREDQPKELRIEAPGGYTFPTGDGGRERSRSRVLGPHGAVLLEISEIP